MARIVVMEDDKDVSDLVRYRLAALGMDVEVYFNGKSGLEAMIANPPDLAIIDIIMPKMGGLDVTRALRANASTKNVPIIVFTALGQPENEREALEAGAEYYAIKPFSVIALSSYVEQILNLKSSSKESQS